MSFAPPQPMSAFELKAADGDVFRVVIDTDPAIVMKQIEDIGVEDGNHGLLLLWDRRNDADSQFHWQVWTRSIIGWGATDSEADLTPLPPRSAT